MPSNRYPFIAREGWTFLFVLLCVTILAKFLAGTIVFVICLLFLLGVGYLFRDPYRPVPSQPLAVLSPVYGIVTSIEEVDEIRLQARKKRIRIKMRLSDICSLRSPIEGKIIEQWCSISDKHKPCRHFDFHIKSDEGDSVIIAIRLRNIIRRLHIYLHSGERVGHGQRCGYLHFGGIVDVCLPLASKIQVDVGDYVQSGSSVLAQLIHSEAVSAIQES